MTSSIRQQLRTVVVLALLATHPQCDLHAADIVERCDHGPAPSAPNFVAEVEEHSRVRAALGYDPVCEALLPTIEPARARSPSVAGVRDQLRFQPMPLESSLLARYRLLGATPAIATDRPDANAALRRYFGGANGELIELFEWDLSLGGSVTQWGTGWHSLTVRGQPATLAIFQSNSGKAVSVLTWERNRRHIALTVNRNVKRAGYDDFVRVAESLPDPVAAHPEAPATSPALPPNWPPSVPHWTPQPPQWPAPTK